MNDKVVRKRAVILFVLSIMVIIMIMIITPSRREKFEKLAYMLFNTEVITIETEGGNLYEVSGESLQNIKRNFTPLHVYGIMLYDLSKYKEQKLMVMELFAEDRKIEAELWLLRKEVFDDDDIHTEGLFDDTEVPLIMIIDGRICKVNKRILIDVDNIK